MRSYTGTSLDYCCCCCISLSYCVSSKSIRGTYEYDEMHEYTGIILSVHHIIRVLSCPTPNHPFSGYQRAASVLSYNLLPARIAVYLCIPVSAQVPYVESCAALSTWCHKMPYLVHII